MSETNDDASLGRICDAILRGPDVPPAHAIAAELRDWLKLEAAGVRPEPTDEDERQRFLALCDEATGGGMEPTRTLAAALRSRLAASA